MGISNRFIANLIFSAVLFLTNAPAYGQALESTTGLFVPFSMETLPTSLSINRIQGSISRVQFDFVAQGRWDFTGENTSPGPNLVEVIAINAGLELGLQNGTRIAEADLPLTPVSIGISNPFDGILDGMGSSSFFHTEQTQSVHTCFVYSATEQPAIFQNLKRALEGRGQAQLPIAYPSNIAFSEITGNVYTLSLLDYAYRLVVKINYNP